MQSVDNTIQSNCLEAGTGSEFMPIYDRFSPEVRRMVADAPYNLCAACIMDRVYKHKNRVERNGGEIDAMAIYKAVIDEMTHIIRQQDATRLRRFSPAERFSQARF